MSSRLQGKNILITGAAQGIGLAMAKAFMREDAAVFLVDRDGALLAQAAKELQRSGGLNSVICLSRYYRCRNDHDVGRSGE